MNNKEKTQHGVIKANIIKIIGTFIAFIFPIYGMFFYEEAIITEYLEIFMIVCVIYAIVGLTMFHEGIKKHNVLHTKDKNIGEGVV